MRRVLLLSTVLLLVGCAATVMAPPRYVVFFRPWSAQLDEPARKAIAAAADWARQHPDAPLAVTGYASTIGSVQANKDLSKLRAQIVADTLAADGVAPARIHHHGVGAVEYALDAMESRRVEIVLDTP